MTYRMPIELSKVREFARAVKARAPGPDSADALIPPTMLTSARLLWEPRDQDAIAQLGFDMGRILHGEEEYEFFGPPPRVGQVLTVDARVAETYEREGKRGGTMRVGVVEAVYRDEDGRTVVVQRSVLLERERRAARV